MLGMWARLSISATRLDSISATRLDSISATRLDSISATPLDSISATRLDSISATPLDSISATRLDSISATPLDSLSQVQHGSAMHGTRHVNRLWTASEFEPVGFLPWLCKSETFSCPVTAASISFQGCTGNVRPTQKHIVDNSAGREEKAGAFRTVPSRGTLQRQAGRGPPPPPPPPPPALWTSSPSACSEQPGCSWQIEQTRQI